MNTSEVTQILDRLAEGTAEAPADLLPLVYDELRQLATVRLQLEPPGHTLQATALVHEAYLRLVDREHQQKWDSRRHFFAAAAESMRRILIESARRKQTQKRGATWRRQPLEVVSIGESPQSPAELLALNEALERLEAKDERAALLVKLRYFSGLTVAEAAEVLDLSTRSTERLWTFAKAWLYRELC